MKKNKILYSAILLALMSSLSHADNNAFYIGAETSLVSIGNDDLTITNKDKSTKTYNKIDSSHCNIKVGYQHFKNNRVEIYFRQNVLDTKAGDITTKTLGINYEWAFSSIATDKFIPYVVLGFGGGEASSKIKSTDKAGVGEGSLGIGVHYQFNENLDFQAGYTVSSTGFDEFDNDTTDKTSTIDQDKLVFGVSYKF